MLVEGREKDKLKSVVKMADADAELDGVLV
jgi:hypothetical protein